MATLVPVVLCGGAGTRLWPVSREHHPKPFMTLPDGESLLRKTFARAAALAGVSEVLTITNREFHFATADEFAVACGSAVRPTFVLEPVGRNTAAAVATAALQVEQDHGPAAVLLVLPADHLIDDQPAFEAAVSRACTLAAAGSIATFGIRASSPETGFGYIEFDGQAVLRFVEKPDLAKASAFVASGRFLWNSGMFCFTAATMLRELAAHRPDILQAARESLLLARVSSGPHARQIDLPAGKFAHVPQESIDRAVMERTRSAAVVACELGWSDVGSWNAVSELATPDDRGNRVHGRAILHESRNCFVRSDRLVGAVGVEDLVVVDTPDALLVASRARAQDVRHLYERLKRQGHEEHRQHRTVLRPWGSYTTLEEGPGFKVKRIEVRPAASLSLQVHRHRSEHWIVVRGKATVVNGTRQAVLEENESTFIPAGQQHRLANGEDRDLVIIEVQSGPYLGEDDIVRLSDAYGRA